MKGPKAIIEELLLGIAVLVSAEWSSGQGTFIFHFNNQGFNFGARAQIYGPDTDDPYRQVWGNTTNASPPGTQTYSGAPLTGTNYSVEAFYSLTQVRDIFQLATNASPIATTRTKPFDGYFDIGDRYITEANPPDANIHNYWVLMQVRAWDNAGGQLGSWDEAWNAALAGSGRSVGWSKVFLQQLAIGIELPPGLINFESFNAFSVPEPRVLSLLVLG